MSMEIGGDLAVNSIFASLAGSWIFGRWPHLQAAAFHWQPMTTGGGVALLFYAASTSSIDFPDLRAFHPKLLEQAIQRHVPISHGRCAVHRTKLGE
jgi:hypothetical protein